MFYEPDKRDHGLPWNPFKALVVPRPIGWIATIDDAGCPNLAPFSFFTMVASDPPCVVFGASSRLNGSPKDTRALAEKQGEFVVSLASYDQREVVVATSFPFEPGVNEFKRAGLEELPSRLVRPPRVGGAPAHLECVHLASIDLPSNDPVLTNAAVLGRVIGVHIEDAMIVDGRVAIDRLRPISRLGYTDYATVDNIFSIDSLAGRPKKL